MSTAPTEKPLRWIKTELAIPPMTKDSVREAGFLIRRLQRGELLGMPHSRPMPTVGKDCHELRLSDENHREWRIHYRIDPDAIVLAGLFPKTSEKAPPEVLELVRKRLKHYGEAKKAGNPRKSARKKGGP